MPIRFLYFFGFIVVLLLLTISVYLEYFEGMLPCPLCSIQRLVFCLLGLLLAIGLVIKRGFLKRLCLNSLLALTSLLGLILSGRHIWIQHHPAVANGDCAAGIQYMLETFPVSEVIYKVFVEGGTDCAKRGFEFLAFNMAEWAFIWFFLFLIFSIYLLFRNWLHAN